MVPQSVWMKSDFIMTRQHNTSDLFNVCITILCQQVAKSSSASHEVEVRFSKTSQTLCFCLKFLWPLFGAFVWFCQKSLSCQGTEAPLTFVEVGYVFFFQIATVWKCWHILSDRRNPAPTLWGRFVQNPDPWAFSFERCLVWQDISGLGKHNHGSEFWWENTRSYYWFFHQLRS